MCQGALANSVWCYVFEMWMSQAQSWNLKKLPSLLSAQGPKKLKFEMPYHCDNSLKMLQARVGWKCVMLFFKNVNFPSITLETLKKVGCIPSAKGPKKWKFDIPHHCDKSPEMIKWHWLKVCDAIFGEVNFPRISLGACKKLAYLFR